MAVTSLGKKQLNLGKQPVHYKPIKVKGNESYLLFADISIEILSNIYSDIRLRFAAMTKEGSYLLLPDVVQMIPLEGIQTFEFKLPAAIGGDTMVEIRADRISRLVGGGDTAGNIYMEILFNEDLRG